MKANLAGRIIFAVLMLLYTDALARTLAQETPPPAKEQKPAKGDWFAEHREEQEKLMKETFPKAPATVRKVECFRGFSSDISMYAIVAKCGRPDGDPCSGVGCFFYNLEDGSRIVIGWTKINHISSIDHVLKSGKSISLLAKK